MIIYDVGLGTWVHPTAVHPPSSPFILLILRAHVRVGLDHPCMHLAIVVYALTHSGHIDLSHGALCISIDLSMDRSMSWND